MSVTVLAWQRSVFKSKVSTSAKTLAAALALYMSNDLVCWPSWQTLAGDLGCKPRTAKKWAAELKASGALSRVHTGAHLTFQGCTQVHSRGAQPCTAGVHTHAPRTDQENCPIEQEPQTPTEPKRQPDLQDTTRASDDQGEAVGKGDIVPFPGAKAADMSLLPAGQDAEVTPKPPRDAPQECQRKPLPKHTRANPDEIEAWAIDARAVIPRKHQTPLMLCHIARFWRESEIQLALRHTGNEQASQWHWSRFVGHLQDIARQDTAPQRPRGVQWGKPEEATS